MDLMLEKCGAFFFVILKYSNVEEKPHSYIHTDWKIYFIPLLLEFLFSITHFSIIHFLFFCIFLFFFPFVFLFFSLVQLMMMIVKHRLICLSSLTIICIRCMHRKRKISSRQGKGQFSKKNLFKISCRYLIIASRRRHFYGGSYPFPFNLFILAELSTKLRHRNE